MNELTQKRAELDLIDKEMAKLFEKRLQAVETIAEYKKQNSLPVLDAEREKAQLKRNAENVENLDRREYYISFMKSVLAISKSYQSRMLEGRKVAYCGIEGAFAHVAAKKRFPEAQIIGYPDFAGAYAAVESGECDTAVLPIENSNAGDVGMVMDLMFSGGLFVNGIIELEVMQNLLALPGTRLEDVKTVVSHPQALEQCGEYVRAHGYETISYANTALAAQFVKEQGNKSIAAIASAETAGLFGLEIISPSINTDHSNATRFAIFSRSQRLPKNHSRDEDEHFILLFTTRNEAGALVQPLNILGAHNFNMRNLRSRPLKGSLWSYYFFVEADGNISTQNGKDMLNELSAVCAKLKLAGAYGLS